MPVPHLIEWLGQNATANPMNGPEWAFPTVESLHFIGFALLIGTIAIVDLRMLGLGMKRQTAAQLVAGLLPWTWAGVIVMLTTGPMMFSADPLVYYFNPSFRIKMICLAAALVFNFTVHNYVARRGDLPGLARVAACVSLLLWTAVLGAGRMIAFV